MISLMVLPLALVAASSALAEQVTLTPVKDNTLYEDAAGAISNGSGAFLFMGRTGDNGEEKIRRTALAFDLTSIPASAVVESVSLTFRINLRPFAGANSSVAKLHRLKQDWGEGASDALEPGGRGTTAQTGDVTWLHRYYDTDLWTTPGGDYVSVPSATANFGTSPSEAMTFASTPQLVTDVQDWLQNPATNFGWIVLGDEVQSKNARRMASRENAEDPKPQLTVTYSIPSVVDNLALNLLTEDLYRPIGMAHAGDGSQRLFIVEQPGVIRIFDLQTGTLLPAPFLDISSDVWDGGTEQGLLGLAFHPDYPTNGKFYVNYTIRPSVGEYHTVVAEFEVSEDPDVAESNGTVILQFEQPATNHNGGDLHFGPDGYLYIATGDGGGREDEFDNGQNVNTLLGALLRIDVDGTPAPGAETCGAVTDYGIPAGNAFPGTGDGCDEILHFGLRNPWRFSFDAQTTDLWIADVGQYDWEEVNRVSSEESGLNFGWSCREGAHDVDYGSECISAWTDPVIEYGHDSGNCSITGGYVYRGASLPLNGRYLYGDWCTATVWVATLEGSSWISEEWPLATATLKSLASFGQDEWCNLYLIDRDAETGGEDPHGALYRIEDTEFLFGGGFERSQCR
jgi:glucose/arabinose dehydrogenase